MINRLKTFSALRRHCGWPIAWMWVAAHLLRRVPGVRLLLVFVHEGGSSSSDAHFSDVEGFTIRVATPEEVLATSAAKPRFLPVEFAQQALDKGDVCVGAFQNDQLVYYGWYSGLPTSAFDTLLISIGPGCWYGYNAMTLPKFRGLGLHAAAIRFAPRFIADYGATRLIFYVEASNEKPLLATARAGLPPYGITFIWERPRQLIVRSTRLCRDVGFRVTRVGRVDRAGS